MSEIPLQPPRGAVADPRTAGEPEGYAFGTFRLDRREEILWANSEPVRLRPKTFAVLLYLLEHAGRLSRTEELLEAIWGATNVTLGTVNTSIRELRKVLGDDVKAPTYIATVHRRGFRFLPEVRPLRAAAEAPAPHHARGGTFVGRARELERLGQLWSAAIQGHRQTVFVAGDSGVGKTTLVERFVETIAPARVAWGQAMHVSRDAEPYHPLLDAWTRFAGSNDRTLELRETLRRHAPTWGRQLSALLQAEATPGPPPLPVGAGRMVRELLSAFDALTEDAPLLLVLEDLHWSDRETIEALDALTRRTARARLLVIATFRPIDAVASHHPVIDLYRGSTLVDGVTNVELDALDAAAVEQHLAERFGPGFDAGRWAGPVRELTYGNPLLIDVVLRQLEAGGFVESDGGLRSFAMTRAQVRAEIPRSLSDAVPRMLATLSTEETELLETASVVGETFGAHDLVEPQHVESAESFLELLADTSVLVDRSASEKEAPDEPRRFAFRHAAFRNLLYRGIPIARRRRLHGEVGRRLEARCGADRAAHAAVLLGHFEQAKDPGRALDYSVLAAETAVGRYALKTAERHLRRALELVPDVGESTDRSQRELAIRLMLARVLGVGERWGSREVRDNLNRCIELSREQANQSQTALVLLNQVRQLHFCGELGPARTVLQRLQSLDDELDSPLLRSAIQFQLGHSTLAAGELAKAAACFARAAEVAIEADAVRAAGGIDPRIQALCVGAWCAWLRGRSDDAWANVQRAKEEAAAHQDPVGQAAAQAWRAELCRRAGRTEELRELRDAFEAATAARGMSFRFGSVIATFGAGLVTEGRVGEGVEYLKSGLAEVRQSGATMWMTSIYAALVEALVVHGAFDEGLAYADEALACAERTGERVWEAELHRLRAELLHARGEASAAVAELDRAEAVATTQGAAALRSAVDASRARLSK